MNNVNGSQDFEDDQYLPYWPVFRKFSGSFDWPSTALLLPGKSFLIYVMKFVCIIHLIDMKSSCH